MVTAAMVAAIFDQLPDMPLAACKNIDTPDLFFPMKGPRGRRTTQEAKTICRPCQERDACRLWALNRMVAGFRTPGVWGGTTELDRRHILKEKRAA